MAVVFTASRPIAVVGDRKMAEGIVTFTGATSYATGGIATVAADYGLSQLDNIEIMGQVGGVAAINRSGGTYKYVLTTTIPGATEVAAAGDPTGKQVYVRAYAPY